MHENYKWIAGGVAFVVLAVGAVLYRSKMFRSEPPAPPVVAAPAKPAPPPEPAIKHPLPPAETPEPLPALGESDVPMRNALTELFGQDPVQRFLVPEDLVRHIVVTIDNLPEQKVAERLRPLRPTPGTFAVSGSEDVPVLDPANYQRYQALVQLIRSVDTQTLITTYARYYPLFQEAYADLGHPPQYFNDRLVQVIDHLLATPEVRGPVALARPNVLYEYADPKLEALSAGQKVLIRMGSENATVVKDKLRELRAALVLKQP